jgi:hypothetical protein
MRSPRPVNVVVRGTERRRAEGIDYDEATHGGSP